MEEILNQLKQITVELEEVKERLGIKIEEKFGVKPEEIERISSKKEQHYETSKNEY